MLKIISSEKCKWKPWWDITSYLTPQLSSYFSSKWKVKVKVAQSCLTLCDPMDYTVHGILQNTGVGSLSLLQGMDLPNPGIKPRSPTLQADSLPAKPQGKPKNTGLGSLSLIQWIFPTQELNQVSCIAEGFFTNWAIRESIIKKTTNNKCWQGCGEKETLVHCCRERKLV